MKPILRFSLLVAAVLGLAACSTIRTRIDEKSSVYNSLDANTRAQIARGEVGLGYTPDMVYIALGQPDVKRVRHTERGTTETWIYLPYYAYGPYPWDGGWGWGGWGWAGPGGAYYRRAYGGWYYGGYSPHLYYTRHAARDDSIRVTFENGRVIRMEAPMK